MASKLFMEGKQLTGIIGNALKINCKDKNGNKSTVQAELNKLNNLCEDNQNNIEERVPFNFGIDENGNYGYIKEGADSVTPFSQYIFTSVKAEVTKGDAAKTYTYTVTSKGKYLVKMFNTSCEGYNSTFTLTTTNGTNTIFANDDVISATTSKSRTRILLAICDMEVNGVISCAKTSAAGYGIHGMYVYKID